MTSIPGFEKSVHDVDRTIFVVNTPHLRVTQAWTLRKLLNTVAIEVGYNTMVKHLAHKPWEGWHIPMNALWESHSIYEI